MQLHSCLCQILHVYHLAAAVLAQRHYASDIIIRRHDICLNDRLLNAGYEYRIRQI